MFDEPVEEISAIKGKVVAYAAKSKDVGGYDTLQINFTDGSYIEVVEQGQAGYFTYKVVL